AEGWGDAEERGDARRPPVLLAHLWRHEDEHAVDLVARDAAVLDRPLRAPEAEAHGARAGDLAESGEPDPDDGVAITEARRVGHASGRVRARSAAPTSFRSPSWFSIQISQSTRRAAPSSRTAVTRPRHLTTSPGQVSFASVSRASLSRTTKSGVPFEPLLS